MHNFVLSPIDPEKLIKEIADKVTEQVSNNVVNALSKKLYKTDPETKDTLLNAEQAAKFLSLSITTLYIKVSRNELPVMKRGKRLYFSLTELEEYIKAGRKKTAKEIEEEAEKFLTNKSKQR